MQRYVLNGRRPRAGQRAVVGGVVGEYRGVLRDLGPVVAGGVERARAFAKRLDASLAIIDKRRVRANQVEEMRIIGDVKGRAAVIVDDIIDTAGTMCKAAEAVMAAGALRVLACAAHGVLSGAAVERINKSVIDKLFITDTIAPRSDVLGEKKIRVVTVADFMAEAIRRTHQEESISSLFE